MLLNSLAHTATSVTFIITNKPFRGHHSGGVDDLLIYSPSVHITSPAPTSIQAIIVAGLMLISRAPARKTSDNSGSTLSTATHTLYLSQSSLLIFSPPLSSTLPEKPFPLHVSFV